MCVGGQLTMALNHTTSGRWLSYLPIPLTEELLFTSRIARKRICAQLPARIPHSYINLENAKTCAIAQPLPSSVLFPLYR